MKNIITWNVNGIRAIQKKGFLDWFKAENPDILCLQESKAHRDQVEDELIDIEGYSDYWVSAKKRGYSGLVVYSKEKPLEVNTLGIDIFDDEGRVLVVDYENFSVINTYFPNSQEKGKRLDYKLAFCKEILDFTSRLVQAGQDVILCGDFNIAHTSIDLKNPDGNKDSPGYLPEERAWMSQFLDSGFIDCFRLFCKDPDHYTWWSYRTRARERNAGWRIDYHCVNEGFQDKLHNCKILSNVFGSDHCPVKLTVVDS